MADHMFTDVRRFAVPPGRPYGERFERRPPRSLVRPFVRRWLGRRRDEWLAPDPAFELPAYLSQFPRRGA